LTSKEIQIALATVVTKSNEDILAMAQSGSLSIWTAVAHVMDFFASALRPNAYGWLWLMQSKIFLCNHFFHQVTPLHKYNMFSILEYFVLPSISMNKAFIVFKNSNQLKFDQYFTKIH
jgi:hypothetical protein